MEATSPGLTPARVTIAAIAVRLRPQVAVWEREVPVGPGVTGLWRPGSGSAGGGRGASRGGGSDAVFTFRQAGTKLTGTVEGGGGRGVAGGGSGSPAAIEAGKVDDSSITFRVGTTTYTGTLKGDQIELQRSVAAGGRGGRGVPAATATSGAPRPAIGPLPEGSIDPSMSVGLRPPAGSAQSSPPLILGRVER